jgi:hypothetical protein
MSKVESHVEGGSAIAVEGIESIEENFNLVSTPDVIVIVPSVGAAGEDVHLETGDNAKVVTCALHCPQKIAVALFADLNGLAIGQHNIELDDIVAHHAIETFVPSMATPKAGAHHTDAIAGASGGNVAAIPEVPHGLTAVGATSKPSRLAAGLDGDILEICNVDLNAVEGLDAFSVAVGTVYGQEFDAVFVAVFDLDCR